MTNIIIWKLQFFKNIYISCFIPSVSSSWRSCPLHVLKSSECGKWSSTTIWCVALCCFMKWCETKPAIFSSSLCGMYLPGCIVESFSLRIFSRASSVSSVEHTNNRPSSASGKMKQLKYQTNIFTHTLLQENLFSLIIQSFTEWYKWIFWLVHKKSSNFFFKILINIID